MRELCTIILSSNHKSTTKIRSESTLQRIENSPLRNEVLHRGTVIIPKLCNILLRFLLRFLEMSRLPVILEKQFCSFDCTFLIGMVLDYRG